MISKAEKRLHLTTKRASISAEGAYTAEALARKQQFFELSPPFGVKNVPLDTLIDIDESSWTLEKTNRHYGKAYRGIRVKDFGQYHAYEKVTLVLAIGGDGRFLHVRLSRASGTTVAIFYEFLSSLIDRIPNGRTITFLWDNLKTHLNKNYIDTLVQNSGHNVIPRPPYSPELAPIELIFNQIEHRLATENYNINSLQDLTNGIQDILKNLHGIRECFIHCGYRNQ